MKVKKETPALCEPQERLACPDLLGITQGPSPVVPEGVFLPQELPGKVGKQGGGVEVLVLPEPAQDLCWQQKPSMIDLQSSHCSDEAMEGNDESAGNSSQTGMSL